MEAASPPQVPPAHHVQCPFCGAEAGRPCWRRWDVHGSLLAEVATPGYCQARHALARTQQ
jgi:hypothetical protein